MAVFGDIQAPQNPQEIRQVMDYLRQLEDQLRYILHHIGAENLQPGAVGENQLSPQVKENIQTVQKTVKDMRRSVSTYRQSAEEIGLEVRRMNTDGVEKVKNAALTINADGIDMSSGEINIRAGSAFRAKSGGVFEVFAADENSFLKFGGTEENPNASLGNGGTLRVKTIYADSIHAGSTDTASSDGSLASRVVVSADKPRGHGILWAQPQGVVTADYTLTPATALPMDGVAPQQTLTLSCSGGAPALAGDTCRYGVKFSLYNHSGSCVWTGVQVYAFAAGQEENAALIYEAAPNRPIGVGDYFQVDTLTAPSAALPNLTGAADLCLRVVITKSNGTHASFPAGSRVILRCFTDDASSADAQPCEIKYIP